MNISNNTGIDSNDLAKRGESLIRKSTNRYLTTVKIAFRAKQRRFDDFDGLQKSQLSNLFKGQLLNSAMNKTNQIYFLVNFGKRP